MRRLKYLRHAPPAHWVGDGFNVSPLFSHMDPRNTTADTSPFLMLDYAAPREFAPNSGHPRGVGAHPHRGFETVTVAYAGEVAHRDTSGGGGVIREGDVQWMTAGGGIVHEEFHSPEFSARGGVLEMAQLWVNLPRASKRTPARYQHITAGRIPVSADEHGSIRLIAGSLDGIQGAADTFTEMNVWDVRLNADAGRTFRLPENHNLMLVVRRGRVLLNGSDRAAAGDLAVFEREAGDVSVYAEGGEAAEILLLSGMPIDEPVAAHGPFVMNTQAELVESFQEFRSGKYGRLD